jgi:hypothetical protein
MWPILDSPLAHPPQPTLFKLEVVWLLPGNMNVGFQLAAWKPGTGNPPVKLGFLLPSVISHPYLI